MSPLSVAGFTNLGYRLHSRRFESIEPASEGRTVVITGGTAGIGRAAVEHLGRLGWRVALVGRNPVKLEYVAAGIPGEVVGHQADLSLMAEIRDLAARLSESEPSIDALVNNVGVFMPGRTETIEGLETTFATNLAGQYLLTELLIPRLRQAPDPRVVSVSSSGMYATRIRPDDLQSTRGGYQGPAAYAHTKRGQVVLTEMWALRHQATGIAFHAMHPGWVATTGLAQALPTFVRIMKPLLRTPPQGADTIAWLTAADIVAYSGGFWFDRRRAPTHVVARTRETEADREAMGDALADVTGV